MKGLVKDIWDDLVRTYGKDSDLTVVGKAVAWVLFPVILFSTVASNILCWIVWK